MMDAPTNTAQEPPEVLMSTSDPVPAEEQWRLYFAAEQRQGDLEALKAAARLHRWRSKRNYGKKTTLPADFHVEPVFLDLGPLPKYPFPVKTVGPEPRNLLNLTEREPLKEGSSAGDERQREMTNSPFHLTTNVDVQAAPVSVHFQQASASSAADSNPPQHHLQYQQTGAVIVSAQVPGHAVPLSRPSPLLPQSESSATENSTASMKISSAAIPLPAHAGADAKGKEEDPGTTNNISHEAHERQVSISKSDPAEEQQRFFANAKRRMDEALQLTGIVYGSAKTGLFAGEASDLDLTYFIAIRDQSDTRTFQLRNLEAFAQRLNKAAKRRKAPRYSYRNIEVVRGARVPLVRCVYRSKNKDLAIEITVNNSNGVMNSNLLAQYMTCPVAKALALRVKSWAREKKLIRNVTNGLLSSYTYTLLAVAFLQWREILPNLQDNTTQEGWLRSQYGERWDWAQLSGASPYCRKLEWYVRKLSSREIGASPPESASLDTVVDVLESQFFNLLDGRIDKTWRRPERYVLSIKSGGFCRHETENVTWSAVAAEDPFELGPNGRPRILSCTTTEGFDELSQAISSKVSELIPVSVDAEHALQRDKCGRPLPNPPALPLPNPPRNTYAPTFQ